MPDLDQAVTELVDAYRPGPPPAFAVLEHRALRRRRSRRATAALGVAAAVTATAVLPSTLAGRDTSQQPAHSGAIPFATTQPKPTDAPPPEEVYAGRSGPGLRDCHTSELALAITWQRESDGLAGQATVSFRPYTAPATKMACRLSQDDPSLVLLGPGDGAIGPRSTYAEQPDLTTKAATPSRVVSDGVPVVVPLRLTGSNCINSDVGSLVGLTDGLLQATFTSGELPCDRAEPARDGRLVVGLPHGADQPSALVPVDRQRLQVSLEAPQQTTDGDRLRFLVHLRNPTDRSIALAPCPTYMLTVGRRDSDGSTTSARVGHLNCENAPAAVPADGELVFEMFADDPAAGQPGAHDATQLRLRWGIAGPSIADASVALARADAVAPAASSAAVDRDVPVCDASALATVATGGGVESNGFTGADIELTNTAETTCRLPELISSLAVADTAETHNLPIEQTRNDHGGPQTLATGETTAFGIASIRLDGSGSCDREAPADLASPSRLQFQLPGQPAGEAVRVALPDNKRFTLDCWPVVVNRMRKPDGGWRGTALSGTAPDVLWPADSDTPAAGACGSGTGSYATVEADPDTPMPRCLKITGDQRLRVVNASNRFGQAGRPIFVTFAGYATRRLAAGQTTVFDRPARSYLEPGVHDLHLSLYPGSGGAAIWLQTR